MMKPTPNLRFVFVQLLFSLAIGQVALKTGDLVVEGHALLDTPYIYSHLFLCVIILSTSWVGYQVSQSYGNSEKINTVFSYAFIILLIDIFLVVSYFIIVRGAEINAADHTILPPDSRLESVWASIIFFTYLVWDFFTKSIQVYFLEESISTSYRKVRIPALNEFKKRAKPTLLCLLICLAITFLMPSNEPWKVVSTDFALIATFLLFRGLKQETKRKYKLRHDQISDVVKRKSGLSLETEYTIEVIDGHYEGTRFVVKYVPVILLVVSCVLYFVI